MLPAVATAENCLVSSAQEEKSRFWDVSRMEIQLLPRLARALIPWQTCSLHCVSEAARSLIKHDISLLAFYPSLDQITHPDCRN